MGLGSQGDDQSGVLVICADLPHSPLGRIRQWLTRLPSNGVDHEYINGLLTPKVERETRTVF